MDEELTPEEALSQRHKQEKKELQATIQGLKKTATKGDKKKKKEVQEQIAKLEAELNDKHSTEIKALKETIIEKVPETEELAEEISKVEINNPQSKVSKAQKRRNKKELTNKEREQRIAEQEVENEQGLRNLETLKIKEELKKKSLMIFDIPSDGDCLYKAFDHGLAKISVPLGIAALRNKVSEYILSHPADYLPFLTNSAGDTLNEEQFKDYCSKIATSKQWGGQVELDALTHVTEKAVVVVQGDGPELLMGEGFSNQGQITLTYHRHLYRLGEHYNSVQPYQEEPDF